MPVRLLASALLVAGSTLLLHGPVAASTSPAPTCYDVRTGKSYEATKWLTAPGRLVGTSGRDVLVGSTGDDVILGLGGSDIICSAPSFGDSMPDSPNNVVDGGAGNDSIVVRGVGDGGAGSDAISVNGGNAFGGSGNDVIYIGEGKAAGESGADTIIGVGAIGISGGPGNDNITNNYGDPDIDCGSGQDTVTPNGATNVRFCETTLV